jgi:hypothetical protein
MNRLFLYKLYENVVGAIRCFLVSFTSWAGVVVCRSDQNKISSDNHLAPCILCNLSVVSLNVFSSGSHYTTVLVSRVRHCRILRALVQPFFSLRPCRRLPIFFSVSVRSCFSLSLSLFQHTYIFLY